MANSTTQFGGFLTNVGVARQANTAALGLPWNITHMLIGDAGGDPSEVPDPTPKPTQTALVRQVYRAQLNTLFQSPADPAVLIAEMVIPPEIGGWWVRELGLEDADGNFIAVAKPPPSYKPLLVQGSGRTQTIRMHVVFGNLANISLKVDPSIVLATREYVDKAREATELYVRNQVKAHAEASDPHPQYLRRADVAKDIGPLTWLGAATGTANALVLKLKSAESVLSAYTVGQNFQFQAIAANTGAVTARINDLAAVPIKKLGAAGLVDLAAGDLRAGVLYELTFDGTFFQLGAGAGYGIADAYTKPETDALLQLKAPLASPQFTGVPSASTAAPGTSTKQLANTEFVQLALAALVASSPGALDTLSELAAALGNDPNFATTMLNALAEKAAKATTLAGYNIGDAYTKPQVEELIANGIAHGLFSKEYVSAALTFPIGVVYTLAHNFGMSPRLVTIRLKCIVDDVGYVVGKELDLSNLFTYPGSNGADGFQVETDSPTEIRVKVGAGQILTTNGASGSTQTLVLNRTRWNIIVRAFA